MILLTGATGYVGGRLLPVLEARGERVRCLARRPAALADRTAPETEVVRGDVNDRESLDAALEGVRVAYYLVHSMEDARDFEEREREAARAFGAAAARAGVERIVYLGGLGTGPDLSAHLRSRQETGRIFAESGVPTIELRASIVIGSGSLSFEMVRALVLRLPVMVTPRWTASLAQPIAIEDVLVYLAAAADLDAEGSRVYEIGGPDRVSYRGLMRELARQLGLTRLIIPVPVLTPGLSSLWLSLVTPLFARVGRKLIEGVRNDTVVVDESARRDFPVVPIGFREAIARALRNEDREFAVTRWSDALTTSGPPRLTGPLRGAPRFVDSRVRRVRCPPDRAFAPIRRIGGSVGWYYGNALWRIRGVMDALVGGVGLRRGRRDPERLRAGETVDFWRVDAIEENRLLRLAAEMRMPGRAWLQFEVDADGAGSVIRQTAIYDPGGLSGILYWYALGPVHDRMFGGMLRRIAEVAEAG